LNTGKRQKIYLRMKNPKEALDLFLKKFCLEPISKKEEIPVQDSPGRITAEPVFARLSSPSYHSAAMDGVAVFAEDTYGATDRNPKTLKIGQDAVWINTGQIMPENRNAVIMAEKLNQIDDKTIEIHSSAFPWQHVRKIGEDFVVTELLFPQNHKIRPFDLGTLIGGGIFRLKVRRRPKVLIIPTGSGLRDFKALSNLIPLSFRAL
jgi:putative molybdopterin biosynthesis protein